MSALDHAAFLIDRCECSQIVPLDIVDVVAAVVGGGVIVCAGGENRRVIRALADGGSVQRDGDGGDGAHRHCREGVDDPERVILHERVCGVAIDCGRGALCECVVIIQVQAEDDPILMSLQEFAGRRIQIDARGHVRPVDVIYDRTAVVVCVGVVGRTGGELRRVVRCSADDGRVQGDGGVGDVGIHRRESVRDHEHPAVGGYTPCRSPAIHRGCGTGCERMTFLRCQGDKGSVLTARLEQADQAIVLRIKPLIVGLVLPGDAIAVLSAGVWGGIVGRTGGERRLVVRNSAEEGRVQGDSGRGNAHLREGISDLDISGSLH